MDVNITQFEPYEYWDSMDGNSMVCSPQGPSAYRGMCIFNQYILGVIFIIQALSLLYNTVRLRRLLSIIVPENNSPIEQQKESKQQRARQRAQTLYFIQFTRIFGVEFLCVGASHLIGGQGTVYSTSTFAGLLSDLAGSTSVACTMYHSLLQMRGAKAFRSIIELPAPSGIFEQKRTWVSYILDTAQGTAAFPISFAFWFLLATGILTRSEFYTSVYMLNAGAGVRSLINNILGRIRTIILINKLQRTAGGEVEARRSRRNTLIKKARALIAHMIGILTTTVFFPLSVVIFGSIYSSTQMLINQFVGYIILSILMSIVCVTTHKHVSKDFAREESRGHTANAHAYVFTIADVSGMSVVGVSEIVTLRTKRTRKTEVEVTERTLVTNDNLQ